MEYIATVVSGGFKGDYEVEGETRYLAELDGATKFLRSHPLTMPRGTPVRPYYLVINNCIKLKVKIDRRVRYA